MSTAQGGSAVSKSRYKEIADKLHRSGVGVDSDKALEV